jgi:RNA polymerase sigma-70 factor (ECF subfamily)
MALAESAWLSAYRRLQRPLYNVLYRWLWSRQDCEDLMHEAFLRVWDKRDAVHEEGLDALIYRTALNLARNRLRWRELWQFVGLDASASAGDDPLLVAEVAERELRLRQALLRLSRTQRNVILLSEYAGLSTQEIAVALDIAPGTVGSRKHQALAALKQHVGKLGLGEDHD